MLIETCQFRRSPFALFICKQVLKIVRWLIWLNDDAIFNFLMFGHDFRFCSRTNDNGLLRAADTSLLRVPFSFYYSQVFPTKWESTRTLIRSIILPYSTLHLNELVDKSKISLLFWKESDRMSKRHRSFPLDVANIDLFRVISFRSNLAITFTYVSALPDNMMRKWCGSLDGSRKNYWGLQNFFPALNMQFILR